jgi:hypothetical protein
MVTLSPRGEIIVYSGPNAASDGTVHLSIPITIQLGSTETTKIKNYQIRGGWRGINERLELHMLAETKEREAERAVLAGAGIGSEF